MSITFTAPVAQITRNRYGWPMVVPPEGGEPVPYMRVSKLAKELGDTFALDQWRKRMVVLGMARRPDLVTLASTKGHDDKHALNEIAATAMAAAESDKAANIGTALHTLTERIDEGADLDEMPAEYRADLAAYREAMKGVQVKAAEFFIVCDEVQAAGSPDRLVTLPATTVTFPSGRVVELGDGTALIADVKTGKHEKDYPHGAAQQMSIYARGHLYDPATGARIGHLPSLGVSTEVGLLIHMPAGAGTCDLYFLDLDLGWSLACIAVAVRGAFKAKPIAPYIP